MQYTFLLTFWEYFFFSWDPVTALNLRLSYFRGEGSAVGPCHIHKGKQHIFRPLKKGFWGSKWCQVQKMPEKGIFRSEKGMKKRFFWSEKSPKNAVLQVRILTKPIGHAGYPICLKWPFWVFWDICGPDPFDQNHDNMGFN